MCQIQELLRKDPKKIILNREYPQKWYANHLVLYWGLIQYPLLLLRLATPQIIFLELLQLNLLDQQQLRKNSIQWKMMKQVAFQVIKIKMNQIRKMIYTN